MRPLFFMLLPRPVVDNIVVCIIEKDFSVPHRKKDVKKRQACFSNNIVIYITFVILFIQSLILSACCTFGNILSLYPFLSLYCIFI